VEETALGDRGVLEKFTSQEDMAEGRPMAITWEAEKREKSLLKEPGCGMNQKRGT